MDSRSICATSMVCWYKPQHAAIAARECGPHIAADATVVSIVAGLSIATLTEWLRVPRIIRVMPNTPCLVGKGVSVVCRSPEVSAAAAGDTAALLAAVGAVHEVDEQLLDAVKARAAEHGMSYQRFIRQALETAIQPKR